MEGPSHEEDTQESISMVEVLEEEQQREADVNAVLGASDDKHCTYPQGPLPRQALYSCVTCLNSDQDPAGVCLACSLECHEGHDLYELYTKRNFCCDCGKFGERKCKLWPAKKDLKTNNSYNQNFRGVYCTCHRPYPDPEDEEEDEMIQCVICEDWFHGRHLKSSVPQNCSFEEMTCFICVQKHPFLLSYKSLQVPDNRNVMRVTKEETADAIDVCSKESSCEVEEKPETASNNDTKDSEEKQVEVAAEKSTRCDETLPDDEVQPTAASGKTESPSSDANVSDLKVPECLLGSLKEESCPEGGVTLFWSKNWRTKLCRCEACLPMYKDKEISFITDVDDTIGMYEEKGRQARGSQYEKGMEALSQMNRVQQVEMISGYNDLKTELKDYLKKFADNGKVVKEENIREFFTTMASRKKQKVDIPYYCK